MTRTVSDAKLESRTARAQLKVRKKPYYRAVEPGLHLGYRKSKGGTSWLARLYLGNEDYQLRNIEGIPDDKLDADGVNVLSFPQAQEKARTLFRAESTPSGSDPSTLTVEGVCEEYVEFLKAERKSGDDTASRLKKHVYPKIGSILVVKLTTQDLEKCKRAMVQKDKEDPEVERKSKDSSNRVLSMVKAALNRAFEDEANKIPSDAPWRRVKPFKNVKRARQVHLDVVQSCDLIGVCSGAFKNLVTAALLTGARAPHELSQRHIRDFREDLGTLTVVDGKTGGREIVLTQEAIGFFKDLVADRDPDALLIPRDDGEEWGKNHHTKPMKRAVRAAKLPKGCTLYSLRHTNASQSILAGMNLKLLAENMGTSIRMLEIHYGKFIAASRQKLVEQSSFKLGLPSKLSKSNKAQAA